MTTKRQNAIWGGGCTVLVAITVVAMYFVSIAARLTSASIREDIAAPGPPVTRATLRKVMGDMPLAPGLALDEAATNDPALRLQVGMILGGAHNDWILAFRSAAPYAKVDSWYRNNLVGWFAFPHQRDNDERRRNGITERSWIRNGDRVRLVSMPEHPGIILLLVSSPPPRNRRYRPMPRFPGGPPMPGSAPMTNPEISPVPPYPGGPPMPPSQGGPPMPLGPG